jgi:hypothetical protein
LLRVVAVVLDPQASAVRRAAWTVGSLCSGAFAV